MSAGLVLNQLGKKWGEWGQGASVLRTVLGHLGKPLKQISLYNGHFIRQLHGEQTVEGAGRNGEAREGVTATVQVGGDGRMGRHLNLFYILIEW